MAYVKCVLVGLVTGVATALIWTIAEMVIPIGVMMLKSDGALIAESFGSIADLVSPCVVGFAIGFALTLRRQRRLARSR